MVLDVLVLGGLLAIGLGLGLFMLRRRARREAADSAVLATAVKEGRAEAMTLHPVIDPDRCIGSLSCLSVCPEGDILGVVDGKAALVNPSACIGHGKCALECPVNAITLVFGSEKRGVDLPEVDEFFETSRKGLHIVGELGGMGLIKNAITQGLQLARHLGPKLKPTSTKDLADVIIVGAGPSGLATALGLKELGLSFHVLDQDTLGGTIAHYPRQKVVMTERIDLPFFGRFGAPLISKEQLLESWQAAVKKAGFKVHTGVKVDRIEGEDGAFVVQTSKGPVKGRKVVLAIGRRGTPRKLGVAGEEDFSKVTYRLVDARQYETGRVLVVGGGDAALEAAIQLAQETDAEVSLSYRQAELGKAREANKKRFKELVDQGRIFSFMPSTVKAVKQSSLTLEYDGKQLDLPNDYVIACLGGELPTEFLAKSGVTMTRLHGEALGAKAKRGSALKDQNERRHRRLSFGLFLVGALIVATLFVVGQDYYRLPLAARAAHPGHAFLKPAGPWGHGVGIVATVVMLSNFLYAVRKRWERLKGFSTIRTWLTFHQFVGFLSPLVIVFHAAFQTKNQLATLTGVWMTVVVITGVIGRFLYQLVPTDAKSDDLASISRRWKQTGDELEEEVTRLELPQSVRSLLDVAEHRPSEDSLLRFFTQLPRQYASDWRRLREVWHLFPTPAHGREFRKDFFQLRKLQSQVAFFKSLKRVMSVWRVFHVVLAILLVLLIAAHIGLSLFLGYRWILK
ncbi:MAG: NAD(P)-binding domain-containing protein [Myxococcaceae bacterium]|nr:NAD(P)-binding domain-containing protein [Myxococcaceae bacterium]